MADEDLTGIEIAERQRDLEAASARLLGQLLFAFSYLDTNLGLCLAWVDGGRQLDARSAAVDGLGFHARLEALQREVEGRLEVGSHARVAYARWLEQAHACRRIRNELVHGRWGVDARRSEVVNHLGLPTSASTREVRYTVAGLRSQVEEVERLTKELHRLRDRWPL